MKIFFFALFGTAALFGVASIGLDMSQDAHAGVFRSVEIGLAEPSPRGEQGGLAVPASGASNPSNSISQVCRSDGTVDATITFTQEGLFNGGWVQPLDIYIDGTYRGTTPAGTSPSITVNVPAGTAHTGEARWSQTSGGMYCTGGTDGCTYTPEHTHNYSTSFSFTAPTCTSSLAASCSVAPTTATLGQSVTWSANATGGSGTYTYQWSGTDGLSGTTQNVNMAYSTAGAKTGRVQVTSGGTTTGWVDCSNSVTVSAPPIVASCSVAPTSATTGQAVTWTASASGGTGVYTYSWSGTDGLSGTGSTVNKSYSTTGTKSGSVTVVSGGVSTGPVACSNSVTISSTPTPDVDLYIRNNTTGGSWTGSNINIDPGDQVHLRWDSTNASSCSGTNFTVPGNAPNGTQPNVTEPTSGTRTYTVSCEGATDSVSATVSSCPIGGCEGGEVTLTATPVYVHVGEQTRLDWDTNENDPGSCTLTGPGVNLTSLSSETGSHNVTIYGESTFVLDCPSDDDDATVEVLPVVQET